MPIFQTQFSSFEAGICVRDFSFICMKIVISNLAGLLGMVKVYGDELKVKNES